jgi:acyl-CoA synthetase (AMP-forming)/AMP-acid ligase II
VLWENAVAHPNSLLDRLGDRVRTQPDSTALVCADERVSYARLAAMALAAHARIEALDLPAGPVAIRTVKSARTVALILGCMIARRPFLLPPADVDGATLGTLMTNAACAGVLAAEPDPGGAAHFVDCTPYSTRPAPDRGVPGPDAVAFLLTTAGATGPAKVVPMPVGAVDRYTDLTASQFDIRPGTVVLNHAPLHSARCMLDVWTTLKSGGTSVLVPADRMADGQYLVTLLREHGVEVVQSMPALFQVLAEAYGGVPFASVRRAIVTGAVIEERVACAMATLFPRAGIYNLYGCTETNGSFLHEVGRDCGPRNGLPIGQPLPGVAALIVGADGRVLDGPGTGELWVHTPFQSPGYLAPPDGPARFVRLDGDRRRYFRSGDVVRRDQHGVVTLLGRDRSDLVPRP